MSTETMIDNLAYVMHTMLEKESADHDGISFLANMTDFRMKNFNIDYCFRFMMMLQGYVVPVRVQLFLIVDPPSWFDKIWSIMKPMLAPAFREKVKTIDQSKLPQYLEPNYQERLPDEMKGGRASTDEIVKDFITYRRFVEEGSPQIRSWANNP